MNEGTVMLLGRGFLETTLLVSAPVLLLSLAVGLVVSVAQVLTSVQDMTLTYVVRLGAVAVALAFTGRWMLHMLASYTTKLWNGIPGVLG